MADPVVHFEIPASDAGRASKFYSNTFGWGADSVEGMGYTMLETAPVDENHRPSAPGTINGGMFERTATFDMPGPVVTINVKSIDDAAKKIAENGGEMTRERMAVGDMGFAAYFKDTEGNVLGLWELPG